MIILRGMHTLCVSCESQNVVLVQRSDVSKTRARVGQWPHTAHQHETTVACGCAVSTWSRAQRRGRVPCNEWHIRGQSQSSCERGDWRHRWLSVGHCTGTGLAEHGTTASLEASQGQHKHRQCTILMRASSEGSGEPAIAPISARCCMCAMTMATADSCYVLQGDE